MPRRKPPTPVSIQFQTRYKCENCDVVLDEGKRRCPECNKFASRIEGIECPHCGDFINAEDFPT